MRKDIIAGVVVVMVLLTGMSGCLSIQTPEQPRPTAANGTLEATYQAMDAQAAATEIWAQSQVLVGTIQAADTALAAEGTAQAFRSWQTAEAVSATNQAFAVTLTAQEIEHQAQLASTATAAERAWLVSGWTATADVANATGTAAANAQGTALASTATQAAYNLQATQDAASAMALATSQAAQAQLAVQAAEKDRLDLEAQRLTNDFKAWMKIIVPIFLAVIVLAVVVYLRRQDQRNRVIRRDDRGMAPVMIVDGQVVDPDRMLYPVLDVNNPQLAAPELHARITENAQKVQALAQVKPGRHSQAIRAIKPESPEAQAHRPFVVVSSPAAAGLPENINEVIDADWREGTGSDDRK